MSNLLNFQDVSSHLAALYREGRLTPFLGLGMSLPTCTDWKSFLAQLAMQAGMAANDVPPIFTASTGQPTAEESYRLAETLTMLLKSRTPDQRDDAYRKALRVISTPPSAMIPTSQMLALAALEWPLILTTNYDDLYWKAKQKTDAPQPYRLNIAGRSLPDCHQVLRSLSEPSRPILWALQGYLGGQCAPPEESLPSESQRVKLAQEVVVGHQQYQRAIHAAPHFRRAFGEVFRRRSLLFLGSGLMESYLINLFSEILYHQGPGAYPHFALLKGPAIGYDTAFLQSRLGIVPVFYEDHSEVPEMLNQLRQEVAWPSSSEPKPSVNFAQLEELTFSLNGVRVVVRRGRFDVEQIDIANEAVVVSAGRNNHRNVPHSGPQAASVATSFRKRLNLPLPDGPWKLMDKLNFTYCLDMDFLFYVVARQPGGQKRGQQDYDLEVIAPAVSSALKTIGMDKNCFRRVHVLPVAAGLSSPWHPVHPFAQVRYCAESGTLWWVGTVWQRSRRLSCTWTIPPCGIHWWLKRSQYPEFSHQISGLTPSIYRMATATVK